MDWKDIGIDVRDQSSGIKKTYCPKCRDSRSNKRDKSLSVDFGKKAYHCHYCQWSGYLTNNLTKDVFTETKKTYTRPKWVNKTEIANEVVKYFESRGISQRTIESVKITSGTEYMPQLGKKTGVVCFNYFLDGELVNVKYRDRDKNFKLISGAELILYNIDSIKDSEEIIITEGEMDALSYIEAGCPFTVSVPNGASDNCSYLDNYFESHFDNKKTIYIAADNDRKGLTLQKELIRRFGAERCKIIEYGEGCKDANEHLQRYGAESLKITISSAKEVDIEGLFKVYDFRRELDSLYQTGLKKGVMTGHENLDRYCSFETKRLMICTGKPSSGKSEFIDEITVLLNIRHGWKTVYFSPENFPLSYHASKIISKITGKKFDIDLLPIEEYNEAKQYMNENFFFIAPNEKSTLDTILEKARYAIRVHGARIVVADPWNRIEHQMGNGMNETNYISQQLDVMTNFAQQNDILFILMAHPTKPIRISGKEQTPTLYDISGSANFYNKADYGIVVERDYEKITTNVHVQKVKFKHLGHSGVAVFKYNLDNGRYSPVIEGNAIPSDNRNFLKIRSPHPVEPIQDEPFDEINNLPF